MQKYTAITVHEMTVMNKLAMAQGQAEELPGGICQAC
jgi:hypothetical protein